ncbi:MAG TPA: serine/threonine-protein kinase [Anaeromyxobacter sp.]|nr:serine/threonine-protein kinase [Anaeromyxobacter sp.]
MARPSSPRLPAAGEPIEVGSALGNYELVDLLGKGAMGRVFRGRHVLLGREVAIKVLNPDLAARPEIVDRFFREARVVNDIDHENIVEVTDFVEAPGVAYLVMELLDGTSLRQVLKAKGRKYPPIARLLGIVIQVCEALEAAHGKGVVHRDLKPDNVFVVKRDGEDFVKVLDFGIAKLRDSGDDQGSTTSGMILGTPHYMAPEQALGKSVDRLADVWAAGVVLYEVLAGSVPFTAPSFVELAMKIREQPPKPLPAKTPRGEKIPPALADVVMRCLEKKPADRFRSMTALADALREPRKARFAARARRRLAAAAGGVVALVAAVVLAIRYDVPRQLRGAFAPAVRTVQSSVEEARTAAEHAASKLATAPPAPAPAPASTSRPAASPPKSARAAPARPATVELVVKSSPPGARVVRLDTRERLGRTPLRVDVRRKESTVWLEMTLDGWRPVRFAVDLRKDNTANVEFLKASRKTRRR